MDTYLYENGRSLYVNLTNACTNDCTFCERNKNSGAFGYRLWLEGADGNGRDCAPGKEKYCRL